VVAVVVVVPVGVSEDVIMLTSSSVAVRAPPIWFRIAVAFEVPVIIVPTDWLSSYPPPSPRVELLNIMFMSSLIGGSLESSTSMSSRLPSYSSSLISPFARAFAANAGEILEQKPVKRSASPSSSSLITCPVMVQKEHPFAASIAFWVNQASILEPYLSFRITRRWPRTVAAYLYWSLWQTSMIELSCCSCFWLMSWYS
jgi:hypothetical protein